MQQQWDFPPYYQYIGTCTGGLSHKMEKSVLAPIMLPAKINTGTFFICVELYFLLAR